MSDVLGYLPFLAIAAFIFIAIAARSRHKRRRAFIEKYSWPPGLLAKLTIHHSHLRGADIELVGRGLKQFFLAYLESGSMPVAMPSQVADDLWHEFILYTRHYKDFCDRAFGRFMHHTPAVVLDPKLKASNAGLRRVWWHTCRLEGIDPKNAKRLPLLFALDQKLKIQNGFVYKPDCRGQTNSDGSAAYCGGDFGSSSVDGSTDGFGDSSGGDSDGGGGGGGCGGGGD